MSQPNLKLMVDYCLKDPEILQKLETLGSLDIKTTIECGYPQSTSDADLIWKGTVEQERILLTRDYGTINAATYTPCKHGGILVVHHPRPTADIVHAFVKTLLQCGERRQAKCHFTHLRRDSIKILTHKPQPVIIPFSEKPNLRKIVAGI